MSPDRNDASKVAVLASLNGLRAALKIEPESPTVLRALDQCDRLELAISQFHAEGLRFAAFTLLRVVQTSGGALSEPVHSATRDLKAALETAGYPH